jgi:cobalt-zinc-cadmium efflux system protein
MHNHSHDHHDQGHSHGIRREGNRKGLTIALVITFGIMVAEFMGGWLTNSLALLSDSGHMLSDTASLALSLVAVWFAAKPSSPRKSYGYHRFEILAALLNGVTLFIIAGLIIWEAYNRLFAPPAVESGMMMVIALIGLLANIASAWVLLRQGDVKGNINLRGAYLHVIGDALGSVGALVAGFLMQRFSWYVADPIISVIVAVLILKSAWGLITQSVHILMEGVPARTDIGVIVTALSAIDGVINVHDVHVWTVTSGYDAFSCHMLLKKGFSSSTVLAQAVPLIQEKFGIRHTTIQAVEEDADCRQWGCRGGICSFVVES